ncbi:uncharacterized protein LOC141600783 [Silene latifolia]|uniref:uncharacterized protein LOC141600783 n=1 Tax=Silene latifolia TaxID=37657 RepID=UPI003D786684
MNDNDNNGISHFDSLPKELIWEILSKLPCIKSVVMCKSVSKSCFSVISSPRFIGNFITKHVYGTNPDVTNPKHSALVIRPKLLCPSKGQLLYPKDKESGFSNCFLPDLFSRMVSSPEFPVKVIATSNDLILCVRDDRKAYDDSMYICNPQTIKGITLPRPPRYYKRSFKGFASVPCSTKEGKQVIEYTVIVVNCGDDDGYVKNEYQLEAQVFSSRIGNWKEVSLMLPKPFKAFFSSCGSLFHHGMLYFYDDENGMIAFSPIISKEKEKGDDERLSIVCQSIDWPLDFVADHKSSVTVGLCQERLRLTQKRGMSVNIWDLKDNDNSKWEVRDKIDLRGLASHDSSIQFINNFHTHFVLLGFNPFDDDILYVCVDKNRIVSCDLKKRQLNQVFVIPDESKSLIPALHKKFFDDFRPFWFIF